MQPPQVNVFSWLIYWADVLSMLVVPFTVLPRSVLRGGITDLECTEWSAIDGDDCMTIPNVFQVINQALTAHFLRGTLMALGHLALVVNGYIQRGRTEGFSKKSLGIRVVFWLVQAGFGAACCFGSCYLCTPLPARTRPLAVCHMPDGRLRRAADLGLQIGFGWSITPIFLHLFDAFFWDPEKNVEAPPSPQLCMLARMDREVDCAITHTVVGIYESLQQYNYYCFYGGVASLSLIDYFGNGFYDAADFFKRGSTMSYDFFDACTDAHPEKAMDRPMAKAQNVVPPGKGKGKGGGDADADADAEADAEAAAEADADAEEIDEISEVEEVEEAGADQAGAKSKGGGD